MGAFNLIYTGKLENWNITKILRSENPFIGTFNVISPRKLEYYEVKKIRYCEVQNLDITK